MPRGRPPKPKESKARGDTDGVLTLNAENANYACQAPNSHKCEICLLSFPKESQFQRHMRDHERNDKPHRCDQCPQTFNVEFNLTLHKCTHNGEDPTCPVCHKKFSRVASLKAHIMLHEKEESLICPECGDEFALQSQLAAHLQEHRQELAGGRVHTCKACGKEYDAAPQLREHLKSHHRIRMSSTRSYNRNVDRSGFTYSCPHCGKTFQKPSQLTRHVRIHTGERPFKCSECGKAFNQKGALQTHMIKHTGEKPHACAFCPAAFSQKGNLQSHVQRVHSEVKNGPTYNCTECSCVFKSLGSLNTHISKMHMGGPQSAVGSAETAHVLTLLSPFRADGLTASEATLFQTLPLQQTEAQAVSGPSQPDSQAVTDVIQQLLELSDPGPAEPSQAPQPGQQLSITVGISQDILQQALENSGLSSIPAAAHPSDTTHAKTAGPGQDPGLPDEPSEPAAPADAEPEKEQEGPEKLGRREKKLIKKKSPFLPGSIREENGVRWHVCPYCTKEFRKPSDLVRHIRIHTHEKPFKCPQCFRAFAVKSTLTAHIKTHTGIKAFQCQYCLKSFSTSGSLKVHIRLHTGVRPFACPHCDKKFRTSGHRKTHVASHFKHSELRKMRHQRKPAKVRKASAPVPDIPLQEPILITDAGLIQPIPRSQFLQSYFGNNFVSEADRPYKCFYCHRAYKKSCHLKQHIRSHTGEKPYKCKLCGRGFVSSGVLKSHEKTHTGVKAFSCSVCHAAFTTNGSLTRHMATHMSLKPYKCPLCEQGFRTAVHCRQHVRRHQAGPCAPSAPGEASEGADVCVEEEEENSDRGAWRKVRPEVITFTEEETAQLAQTQPQESATVSEQVLVQSAAEKDRVSELKDRRAELEAEPRFANRCSYCPKSFKKPSDLVRHVRIHTGEKPYKCDECGKSFTVKSTLDCHVKTHTGQKLFSCHVCSNAFSTKGSLKVHMRLHTGAKPFKCPHCELRFRTSGRRKTHMQGHYRPDPRRARKPGARSASEGLPPAGLPPASLPSPAPADPSVLIMNSSVLTGQFEPSLLQPGLVSQAVLPGSVSAGSDWTVSLTDGSLAALEGIQLQLAANVVGPNVQISGIDASGINNITLQIDPSVLQQTLQHASLLAQPLAGESGVAPHGSSLPATDSTGAASVVIQPIAGLSLQPTVTSASLTISPMAEDSVLTTSSGGTQELAQVMSSQGLVSTASGPHEITLTINNSSLSQVLAQAAGPTASASGSPQEITLTISGQDLIQHSPGGGSELNGTIRLSAPAVGSQPAGATLTISNDQLLAQTATLTSPELSAAAGGLPCTAPASPPAISTQNLVMSSSGVGGEASVTLTLADTQGLLSGGLDTVTLNIASQGQQFPALLADPSLSGPGGAGSPQVILVSHTSQPASAACEEIFQVTDVSAHLALPEKEGRLHPCTECGRSFASSALLLQHSKDAHGRERIHVCPACSKAFKRATHLKEHMQTHQAGPSLSSQKPRVFRCDTCEKAFAKPSQLERHSRIHTGERPFHCTLCEKAFNQKSALQVHMKKHTGERPYRCPCCAMGFTQKSNMKLHVKRAHSYPGALQEPAGAREQGAEELGQTLQLEEAVPESAGEWQALAGVF
ncbi:zinc finger protein 236 isoform X4 [Sturnira hondurensis]|uniref:zinc finger protein 236 isoform X4 n=1 Tax=Sturnira hondurensis TaxID=192404 RepID=UPI00187A9F11|nr:zinc finger protein 236 isoform X4 [Sturnira hondurensis]